MPKNDGTYQDVLRRVRFQRKINEAFEERTKGVIPEGE